MNNINRFFDGFSYCINMISRLSMKSNCGVHNEKTKDEFRKLLWNSKNAT